MIISASRRTDIPSFYSDWLFNRLREQYVLVRNPVNPQQISKISLSPEVIDGIVFWTKNPSPMLNQLSELEKYNHYFQFTVNAYGKDVEPNVPSKREIIVPTFQKQSKAIGREKVIWRYDPIFFSEKYDMEYHCKYFEALADRLGDFTERCTVSFLDIYSDTSKNMKQLNMQSDTYEKRYELMQKFSEIAKKRGFYIETCAENIDLEELGIKHSHCIDPELFERIGGYKLSVGKDKNQRKVCGCAASIDIGAYNTCRNDCLYCYANHTNNAAFIHNPKSPLLIGNVRDDDNITERYIESFKEQQMSLL